MKKILFAIAICAMCSPAWAVTDVNEAAGSAKVTSFDVGTGAVVDMSSATIVSSPFAYNITNNDTTNILYCGYTTLVSTSGNYMGFKVRPGVTEYRAVLVGVKIYCIAATATINVTREIFGKPQF